MCSRVAGECRSGCEQRQGAPVYTTYLFPIRGSTPFRQWPGRIRRPNCSNTSRGAFGRRQISWRAATHAADRTLGAARGMGSSRRAANIALGDLAPNRPRLCMRLRRRSRRATHPRLQHDRDPKLLPLQQRRSSPTASAGSRPRRNSNAASPRRCWRKPALRLLVP